MTSSWNTAQRNHFQKHCITFCQNAIPSWSKLWSMNGTPVGDPLLMISANHLQRIWISVRTTSTYSRCWVRKYLIIQRIKWHNIRLWSLRLKWMQILLRSFNYASWYFRTCIKLSNLWLKHACRPLTLSWAGSPWYISYILTWLINWCLCSLQIIFAIMLLLVL